MDIDRVTFGYELYDYCKETDDGLIGVWGNALLFASYFDPPIDVRPEELLEKISRADLGFPNSDNERDIFEMKCGELNRERLLQVYAELAKAKHDLEQFPSSEDLKLLVVYFEIVAGKYIRWLRQRRLEIPILDITVEVKNEPSTDENSANSSPRVEENDKDTHIKLLQNKVLQLRRKSRGKPSREELNERANENRFKTTGEVNFSKLGRSLGVANHTAKQWCKEEGIH